MSTLANNVQSLAVRIGQEVKAVRTEAAAIAADRYTKAEADAAIEAAVAALIDGAPGALDTLNELAAALGNNSDAVAAIATQIALKANASDVNAALALKADASNVNSALALKADAANVYTQSQTNTAIAAAVAPLALNPRLTINLQTSTGSITTDPVIANAMSTISNTNGYTVNLGFGEYREPGPIVLDNKWQLQLVGPQSAGTTAVTIKNGLTIQNSNGVRMTRIQVEGAANISCRAGLGLYFERVQLMGNVTLGGTGGFMMFADTDFAGDVTISPTFAGVVYFVRCNFSKAAGVYTFGQTSALQAILADCSGVPNAGIAKASYTGVTNYKSGAQALFLNNVPISNAGATSGQVLKFNGTAWAPAADAAGDDTKLPLAGGTLTGALTLSGAPTASLHAATKAYVDDALALKADAADLALKADASDLAMKADAASVYTKSEVDSALGSKVDAADIGDVNANFVATFEAALN